MAKIGRNEPCPCGSGKKYKQCCLAKNATERTAARVADPLPHHHPRLCQDCNAEVDAAANAVIALIEQGKLDHAERAAHVLVDRWPDVHDGYDCLAMVAQAKGDNRLAADYYRKVIAFARKDPDLYDPGFVDYFQDSINRLQPASVGALPPHPRDI